MIGLTFSIGPVIYLVTTASSPYDLIGTDYSAFWSAGRQALQGNAGDAYDPALQDAYLAAEFGRSGPPLTLWLHPPVFYLIVTPFALLPYWISMGLWLGCWLAAYICVARHLDKSWTGLALALAYPAIFIDVTHGQTGLLFAALFSGALLCLKPRPYLAGVLIGLMAVKPHLGILVPIALLAGGYYKTIFSAALTLTAIVLLTTIALGPDIWLDFWRATEISRGYILEQGGIGWEKLQSPFAIVRIWGGTILVAYAMQALVFLGAAGVTFWVWSQPIDERLKFGVLISGACLATPYLFEYDLVILAPALGWATLYAIEQGFLPFEKCNLMLIWLSPGIARIAADLYAVPLGLLATAGLFVLITYRTWRLQLVAGSVD